MTALHSIPLSPGLAPHPASPKLERARGAARFAVAANDGTTRLTENHQSGSARIRFPRRVALGPVEAVFINTAGGVTGGDHLNYAVSVEMDASAVVTTQAAERVYRRSSGVARIETRLTVARGGSLEWLPQETIVFNRSALRRTLDVDVNPSGRLLAVEAIVLGRTAMGETATDVIVSDAWRIRRGSALVFADGLRLDGNAAGIMASGATGGGAAALATVVLIDQDAEGKIETARTALGRCGGEGGVSAWNGMLVARLIGRNGQMLRLDLVRLVEALRGAPMPRVWNC